MAGAPPCGGTRDYWLGGCLLRHVVLPESWVTMVTAAGAAGADGWMIIDYVSCEGHNNLYQQVVNTWVSLYYWFPRVSFSYYS